MLVCTAGIFNGCCAVKIEMKVIVEDADPVLNVESYTRELSLGEIVNMEYDIPAGYDHEGFKVTINDRTDIPWEVTYAQPDIEEEYRYTVGKKITFSVFKATSDFTLTIDFSKVKKHALELTVSDTILNITSSTNSDKTTTTNLSVVSVDPEKVDHLITLDSSNILERRPFVNNKATVYYDEYIVLCYSKPSNNEEISTLYTDVNHFTDMDSVLTKDNIKYCEYNVATKGNSFYNLKENNLTNSNTRLFYLGRIQEGFKLYNKIPNYTYPQGFVLSDNENKFSLLTNRLKYNSDLLSINVFAPTTKTYNAGDSTLDKVGDTVLEQVSSSGTLYNRYDRFDMYIGADASKDDYLTDTEKNTIPQELYVSIDSEINLLDNGTRDNIENYLHFHLLHYEKQDSAKSHYTFSSVLKSDKESNFIKIDLEIIKDYIDTFEDYQTGNAILYVEMDTNYIDNSRNDGTFKYTVINYPVLYNGTYKGIDFNYNYEFYILNEDGTKDYGFLDMQKWSEDLVCFRTDKLFKSEKDFNDNLFLNFSGKEYNEYYSEVITTVYVNAITGSVISTGAGNVENPETYNGVNGMLIDLYQKAPGDQYKLDISVIVTNINDGKYSVDFSRIDFEDFYYDCIYVTNNINFESNEDFVSTKNLNNDIMFGRNTEIFYFVVSNTPLDFDLYVNTNDEDRKITNTKQLLDIAGNAVRVYLNGREYDVYIKYQAYEIYGTATNEYLAFTSNNG